MQNRQRLCIIYTSSSSLIYKNMYECRGLEAVKRCERVYLESYTSLLLVPRERLVRCDNLFVWFCVKKKKKKKKKMMMMVMGVPRGEDWVLFHQHAPP